MTQISKFQSGEIVIRQAQEPDVETLALLLAELGYPTEAPMVDKRQKNLTDAAGDCLLVAVDDSQVIGMILLHRTPFLHRQPDGRISTLVVFELYRGRGVGSLLVEAAEKVFRQWNCGRIEVTSGAQREPAHRFYRGAGYLEKSKRFIKILTDKQEVTGADKKSRVCSP